MMAPRPRWSRPRRACHVAAFSFLLASAPELAGAEDAGSRAARPLAESLRGRAKVEYEAARLLFADGDFAGAGVKFKRAHQLSGEPRLLWNMAVCEKELRHYARAAGLVDRYLAQGGARVSAANRRKALETRDALRGFFSAITVSGLPAGAVIFLDSAEIARTPLSGPILVDLGEHRLRVEHASHEPEERRLDVPGSSDMRLPSRCAPRRHTSWWWRHRATA